MVVVGWWCGGSDGEKTKQTWCWSGVLVVVVAKRKQLKCCVGNVGGVGGGGCSKRKTLRKSELTELLRKGILFMR